MSELLDHVNDYLKLRRDLGFKLRQEGYHLPQLVAFIEASGTTVLTNELAIAWVKQSEHVQPITLAHRLGSVRGFARYLQTIDPATEVPPLDVFGARQQRITPYLWMQDEIVALLAGMRELRPELRAATFETLLGLIAVTGMRLGEAIGLTRQDVNLPDGVLTVRQGKFDLDRLIPLHVTTTAALAEYAKLRERLCPTPQATAFFITPAGIALPASSVEATFNKVTTQIGLRTATAHPRIHDLQHSFSVQTIID
ncbi:MAG: tyrosine-type recombinase/integrase [Micrococcaceae bacterium]|nr:tyrosine-type recombinase/integrase [Micrococcaceae bacterium]